jgi:rhodanese-related sulfurtransferase
MIVRHRWHGTIAVPYPIRKPGLPSVRQAASKGDVAMANLSEILARAQERARGLGLPYDGALTPMEAHEVLGHAPGAKLVDVRTRAELEWVGRVPGAVEIEWQTWPGGAANAGFEQQLKAQVDAESLVMFLCRSGGRSNAAAAAAKRAGYTEVYNILEGFEGDKDGQQHRNTVGGWRKAGLPWIQG